MTGLQFRAATLDDIGPGGAGHLRLPRRVSKHGWTTEADLLDGNRIDADVLRADIERPRSRC